MQTTKTIKTGWLLAVLLCFGLVSAHAASITNNDAGNTLNLGTEWVGGTAPGSADVAVWNNLAQVNTTETLGANLSWAGIQILDPLTLITINAGNTLTIGASGIDMSLANNGLTLACPIVLGANQTWNVTNGQNLTVSGALGVSTATSLVLTGSGTNNFSSTVNGTYTGNVTVNSGAVLVPGGANANANSAMGTGIITNNAGATLRSAGKIVGNALVFNGTSTIDAALVSFTLDGDWSGSGTVIITNMVAGSTVTAGGQGNGGGTMNNFTGTILISSINSDGVTPTTGTFRFNNGGSSGAGPNFGNVNATFDLGQGNATLLMRNRGTTVNLGELRGGPNTTISAGTTGSGTITYSIGGKNTSTTYAGRITNSTTVVSITKVGSGTLTLTGASGYTGSTTVNNGVLQVGDGVTVGAGTTLGTGPFVLSGGTLLYNTPDNFAINNAISGSGGTLVKTNTDIMTYNGTSGSSTIISQGTLALGASGLINAPVFVASGAFYDVTGNPSFALGSTVAGFGTVNGLLTATVGGTISPGGSGAAGTLNFANGVTENGSANNQMELSSVGGTNDLINITGNLTLSGVNNVTLSHFGGGPIPNGTYTLMTYSGSLSGSLANLSAISVGNTAVLTNPPNQIAVIIGAIPRPGTNLTWVGDGGANNWDVGTSNWVGGIVVHPFAFQAGDSVIFDQTGAANPTVNLAETVSPGSVVVSNTASYTFSGSGNIGGTGGLVKTNSGTLNVLTTNGYTGPTVIGGGTLVVSMLADGTLSSAIGAASSNPTNLVFYGATLNYTGPSTSTDRGATLNGSGGTFDVNSGTVLTNSGTITGPGALTLIDSGTLTLANPNTYVGGTILSNGVLALGSNLANNNGAGLSGVGPTNEPVTFYGGTLQLYGVGQSPGVNYSTFYNPLVVPAGQVGTLIMFPRGPADTGAGAGLFSSLSGGGTLNLEVNYLRDSLSGDWSAFTGLINVTELNVSGDEMRINNNYGYANASIYLNDYVLMDISLTAGATIDIGELGGTSFSSLGQGTKSVSGPTWCVGWKNTTNTFAGTIADDNTTPAIPTSIKKVGTGTWILTGANTYSGSTTVSNGVLALGDGSTDGSIDYSTNINVVAGAVLDVSGRSDDSLSLGALQTLQGGGTIRGRLNVTGTVAPGDSNVGTLTVTNDITLAGTAWMKLNRAASPNSDRLVSSTASLIKYGGMLVVTNIGAPLHAGDTFTLFSAATLNNTTPFTLALPDYYTWNISQLATLGQISVTAASPPAITNINFSGLAGGSITLNAAHGVPNGPVSVLTSTNLSLPLNTWTTVTNVTFDGSGNLSQVIVVDPTLRQSFYLLQVQ